MGACGCVSWGGLLLPPSMQKAKQTMEPKLLLYLVGFLSLLNLYKDQNHSCKEIVGY